MADTLEQTPAPASATATRRMNTRGMTLRVFAARGVIVNTLFEIGMSGVSLIRGFVLAALLTRNDYGVWGILAVSLGVLARLKLVGVGDKYIQQEEDDQELAFQKAFTLEVLMTAVTAGVLVAALPVFAVVYGQWRLIGPGLALISVLAAGALQTPFWVYYRDMDFVRQRTMLSIEPVVGLIVAVVLAVAGAGYWALAIGAMAGAWTGAAFAVATSRYPLRWRYDRGTLKLYGAYSGPILIAVLCSVVLAYSATIAANAHLGLAAVGVMALCANITSFTTRVDDLVSGTLYPALCAAQDRLDLLRESFVKSNRLALMWAMPLGAGLALFGADLIHYVLGNRWNSAITMLQITGLVAAIGHIGFNWDDYLRARSRTRPIAVTAVASAVTFLAVGIPLMFALGLTGLAIGIGAQAVVNLGFRAWYLTELFEGFVFVRHAMRAMLPTIPAVAVVLLMRQLEPGTRTAAVALADLTAYLLVTAAVTVALEHRLIREAVGYLAKTKPNAAPVIG